MIILACFILIGFLCWYIFQSDNILYFDHISIPVTEDSLYIVDCVRHHLMESLQDIFAAHKINYTLSHGNLIEHARGDKIYQDDDIDIRLDPRTFGNWMNYCRSIKQDTDTGQYYDEKYNISFDDRIHSEHQQKSSGIQVFVHDLNKLFGYDVDPVYKGIHCDVVLSTINTIVWVPYTIDFDKLESVTYLNVDNVKVPSADDMDRILSREYGDWKTPLKKVYKNGREYHLQNKTDSLMSTFNMYFHYVTNLYK